MNQRRQALEAEFERWAIGKGWPKEWRTATASAAVTFALHLLPEWEPDEHSEVIKSKTGVEHGN